MQSNTYQTGNHPLYRLVGGICGNRSFHFDTPREEPAPDPVKDPVTKMREEFSRLHGEAEAVIEKAVQENRELTAEEKTANETRFSRIKQIKSTLDEKAKFAALALTDDPSAKGTVTTPREPAGRTEFEAGRADIVVGETKIDRTEYSRAMQDWLRDGIMPKKFATITTATQNGILLPVSVLAPIATGAVNSFREGYAAWGLQPMQTIGNAEKINIPIFSPNAGGEVSQTASSGTENVPSLAESIVSEPKTYQSGYAFFSNLSLASTRVDLLGSVVPQARINKELGLEAAIAAAMIADSNITQVVNTATTTTLAWSNFVSLNNKLAKRWQFLKVILLGADAYTAAEGLTDDNGRPIMVADAQNQNLKRIGGTPVFRCDNLEGMTANKTVGLIISLMGFHLRDAGEGIARYTQIKDMPDQTGTNLFGYHAYGYAVSAVAKLKTPAS